MRQWISEFVISLTNEHDIEQPALAKVEHPLFLLIGKIPVLRVERSLAEGFSQLEDRESRGGTREIGWINEIRTASGYSHVLGHSRRIVPKKTRQSDLKKLPALPRPLIHLFALP